MIKITSISITNFRGIKNTTLDFGKENYAICGPNGSGKSGIVDAIEFVLTGKISRISGEGQGELSLKEHGPHVDKRNTPESAQVTAKVFIQSLNREFTVKRNLKLPSQPEVSPDNEYAKYILKQIEAHPEITLSRRELIRYVLASPGKRATEVQSLLRLDTVETVRTSLLKISNSCIKALREKEAQANCEAENLSRALEISQVTPNSILESVNTLRDIIGISRLKELEEATSLKEGATVTEKAETPTIPKQLALSEIQNARNALNSFITERENELTQCIESIVLFTKQNPKSKNSTKETFF